MAGSDIKQIIWKPTFNGKDYDSIIAMPCPGYPLVRATHIAMMMTDENEKTALNHYNKVLIKQCPDLKPTQAIMDLGAVSQSE